MDLHEKERQLLEIYKLHASAADDVSRRRDNANRMYLGATTSVGITLGVVARFGAGDVPAWAVVTAMSILGGLLQLGWLGVISSYRQLNAKKFAVLLRLERALPFDFYQQEWQEMGEGKDKSKYQEITLAERHLPKLFLAGFAVTSIGMVITRLAQSCS